MNKLVVKTEHVSFSYEKTSKQIKNLNLEVPEGSIYGFLGPNGAGKTTTIRLLLGLVKHKEGKIKLFGKPFNDNRIHCLRRIGALIEHPSLYTHLTAFENLKLTANYLGNISYERIVEVLELVQLLAVKNKKVVEFSLGMKQRLGLANCLLGKPDFLILDEPTNGLDPKGIIEMRNLIKYLNKNHGTTIFISSHLLSEIEKTCTHIGIISDGKMLFQDTIKVFKDLNEENLQLEIEVKMSDKITHLINSDPDQTWNVHSEFLTTTVKSREDIPAIIDKLCRNRIEIFQIKIKNNLEDLFLSLTEKTNI